MTQLDVPRSPGGRWCAWTNGKRTSWTEGRVSRARSAGRRVRSEGLLGKCGHGRVEKSGEESRGVRTSGPDRGSNPGKPGRRHTTGDRLANRARRGLDLNLPIGDHPRGGYRTRESSVSVCATTRHVTVSDVAHGVVSDAGHDAKAYGGARANRPLPVLRGAHGATRGRMHWRIGRECALRPPPVGWGTSHPWVNTKAPRGAAQISISGRGGEHAGNHTGQAGAQRSQEKKSKFV